MIPVFCNVTKSGYILLDKILRNPGQTAADLFFDDPTVDGQVQLLAEARLVEIDSEGKLFISELGRASLKEFDSQKMRICGSRILSALTFIIPTTISIISLVLQFR